MRQGQPLTVNTTFVKSGTTGTFSPIEQKSKADWSPRSSPRPPKEKWSPTTDPKEVSPFHRLLQELAEVHERQVDELQKELDKHRRAKFQWSAGASNAALSSTNSEPGRLQMPAQLPTHHSVVKMASLTSRMGEKVDKAVSLPGKRTMVTTQKKYSISPERNTSKDDMKARTNQSQAARPTRANSQAGPTRAGSRVTHRCGAHQMPITDRTLRQSRAWKKIDREQKDSSQKDSYDSHADLPSAMGALFAELDNSLHSFHDQLRFHIDSASTRQEDMLAAVLSSVKGIALKDNAISLRPQGPGGGRLLLGNMVEGNTLAHVNAEREVAEVCAFDDDFKKPVFEIPRANMAEEAPLPPPPPKKVETPIPPSTKLPRRGQSVSFAMGKQESVKTSYTCASVEFSQNLTDNSIVQEALSRGEISQKKSGVSCITTLSEQEKLVEAMRAGSVGCRLQVRSIWMEESTAGQSRDALVSTGFQAGYGLKENMFAEPDERRFPLFPASPYRILWNVIGLLAITYDAVSLPMQVFYEHDNYMLISILSKVTLGYWNLDIIANFLVGYYDGNGNLVMKLASIAANYFKSWFGLDFVLVTSDWVMMILDSLVTATVSKSLRFMRFFRIVRLLRLAKVQGIVFQLQDVLVSNYIGIYVTILKTLLSILMTIHFVACLWYGLGTRISKEVGWISEANFDGRSITYRYTTSYHWALAQFGVGEVELQPGTSLERIFAIIVGLFALLAQSTLISSVTGAAAQLRALRKGQNMEFAMLRRFCKHNQINPELTQRILKYLRHAEKVRSRGIAASDLELFRLLSEPLRNELQLAIYKPHLQAHPLLKRLCKQCSKAMMTICAGAISNDALAEEDLYFCFGETAQAMVMVLDGDFTYRKYDYNSLSPRGGVTVSTKQWLSEQALWLSEWTHRGDLTANQEAEVMVIDAEEFGEVSRNFAGSRRIITNYARRFVIHLRKRPEDSWSDFEDPEKFSAIYDTAFYESNSRLRGATSWIDILKSKIGLRQG